MFPPVVSPIDAPIKPPIDAPTEPPIEPPIGPSSGPPMGPLGGPLSGPLSGPTIIQPMDQSGSLATPEPGSFVLLGGVLAFGIAIASIGVLRDRPRHRSKHYPRPIVEHAAARR